MTYLEKLQKELEKATCALNEADEACEKEYDELWERWCKNKKIPKHWSQQRIDWYYRSLSKKLTKRLVKKYNLYWLSVDKAIRELAVEDYTNEDEKYAW